MTKVLFVLKKRYDYYGSTASIGLINSSHFVNNYLNSKGLESKVVEVIDGNGIDKEVQEYQADVVIIEALFVTPAKFLELFKMNVHKKRQWIVRIHSKIPFLANEGIALEWIKAYFQLQNMGVSFSLCPNNDEVTEQLNSTFNPIQECFTLKNIYQIKKLDFESNTINQEYINIGCMGAVRPMKNSLLQAFAAIEFGKRINEKIAFHVNGSRLEQKGDSVLKNLINLFQGTENKLVLHNWKTHEEFLALLKQFDLAMQVSLTESFNIVSADSVSQGVPTLVSEDIKWMPCISKVSPTDYYKIVEKLVWMYSCPILYKTANYWALSCYNKSAKKTWNKFLNIH